VHNLKRDLKPMNRTAALAAFAALVTVAAPACAQDSIHVATTGKTPEQIRLAVNRAANRVCRDAGRGSAFVMFMQSACVSETVRAAFAESGNPDLTAR